MAGMTSRGFEPKRSAAILEDLRRGVAEITDPATGEHPFLNLTDDSVIAQVLGVTAEALGECWAAASMAAVQFDPLKNYGAAQSGTVQLNGITRKYGGRTVIAMILSGVAGTVVPSGSLVGTGDGSLSFETTEDARIGADGTAAALARCTEPGPHDPEPGAVFAILTPLTGGGWNGATNTETVSVGTVQETDTQLRVRQQRSTSLTSYRQIEAIRAAVAGVPGVVFARAYQNSKTYPADERGIPFKEVAVVAEGGDTREIAEALFLRFPVGVAGYGNTTEVFTDTQGVSYPIGFSRPVPVPVAVKVDITVTSRADFPDDGADRIREAILAYAEYGGSGNEDGFPPGADIVCSRLYTPVNSVAGHKVTRLEIATVPEEGEPLFGTDDLAMTWDRVGRFDAERIIVTVTA